MGLPPDDDAPEAAENRRCEVPTSRRCSINSPSPIPVYFFLVGTANAPGSLYGRGVFNADHRATPRGCSSD